MKNLLGKYNVPGPRYTSYPTVPYWTDSPTPEQWVASVADALEQAKTQGIGAALYIHIPFCRSLCTYCGCNKRILREGGNRDAVNSYIDSVLAEWRLYIGRLGKGISVSEIHLGGGTPTYLTADELERLMAGVLADAKVLPGAEFSVEADPRVTSREQLARLGGLGFKRLSLGIQDFDLRVQEIVNRVQSVEEVQAVVDHARELGYVSINYDLIYGLPLQNRASVENTARIVSAQKPDRIAFYGYAHVPWIKPSQRRFTEADLPGGDEKRALYELGRGILESSGYREIGMDHFALEHDSLWKASLEGTLHRNFMGYTPRRVSPLIGLGVSSIGDSWGAFAQNDKGVETYQAGVAKGEFPLIRGHVLNEEDRVLRRHVLELMTRFQTDWSQPENYTAFLETVGPRLAELEKDGLVRQGNRSLEVTLAGRPFLRNICMAFDARLARQAPGTQLFSQTV